MTQPILPLKTAIIEQVEGEKLSAEQLAELTRLQDALLDPPMPADHPRRTSRHFAALVAGLLIMLASALFWQVLPRQELDFGREIASEVVKNHLKLKPLEIVSSSMNEIQSYFQQLDFLPARPGQLESAFAMPNTTLLGGRYCSIKGVTAAQLRYRASDDELSTLYQVPYEPELFGPIPDADQGEEPRRILIKGLAVYLWVEKGLLMALITEET